MKFFGKFPALIVLIGSILIASPAGADANLYLVLRTTDGSIQRGCMISNEQVDAFELGGGPWRRLKAKYTTGLPNAKSVENLTNFYRAQTSEAKNYISKDSMQSISLIELHSAGLLFISQGGQRPSEGNGSAPGPGNLHGLTYLEMNSGELERLIRFAFKNCMINNRGLLNELVSLTGRH